MNKCESCNATGAYHYNGIVMCEACQQSCHDYYNDMDIWHLTASNVRRWSDRQKVK